MQSGKLPTHCLPTFLPHHRYTKCFLFHFHCFSLSLVHYSMHFFLCSRTSQVLRQLFSPLCYYILVPTRNVFQQLKLLAMFRKSVLEYKASKPAEQYGLKRNLAVFFCSKLTVLQPIFTMLIFVGQSIMLIQVCNKQCPTMAWLETMAMTTSWYAGPFCEWVWSLKHTPRRLLPVPWYLSCSRASIQPGCTPKAANMLSQCTTIRWLPVMLRRRPSGFESFNHSVQRGCWGAIASLQFRQVNSFWSRTSGCWSIRLKMCSNYSTIWTYSMPQSLKHSFNFTNFIASTTEEVWYQSLLCWVLSKRAWHYKSRAANMNLTRNLRTFGFWLWTACSG